MKEVKEEVIQKEVKEEIQKKESGENESKLKDDIWKKISQALLITIFFPFSFIVLVLLYGFERTLEIFKNVLSGRYVLMAVLIVTVVILQLLIMPAKV
ncbi:MAG: hypothetical protein HOF66_04940 [Nitrosomonadaceae bacterium]|nr:hypothetical protein [Nitrosomonadaceae bacterium]